VLRATKAGEGKLSFFGSHRENAELADELSYVIKHVMESGKLLNGPEVFAFEEELAIATGRKYAVAVGSATDALYCALVALGIGPGDEVLVPAYSFVASASCVLRAGATPVFVDLLPRSARGAPVCMDLEDASSRVGPRCRAMIWVGLFGGVSNPEEVSAFAKKHQLRLVEDASQSFGATWKNAPAGALGDVSVFSFDRNKPVGGPGTGGAFLTDIAGLAEMAMQLRYHGVKDGQYAGVGLNSQMSSLTAAVLRLKLKHHDRWTERRRQIASAYDAALSHLPIELLRWPPETRHIYHKYVFMADQRAALKSHLEKAGVPTKTHYGTPLPYEPVFAGHVERTRGWPVAENMASRAVSLPIYAHLSDAEFDIIVRALSRFYE